MPNTFVQITGSVQNPDKLAISKKDTIDISVSNFDISASNYGDTILLNFQNNETVVYLDNTTSGSVYYTPLYTENINYDVWKNRINKSFRELGAV